ncbi:MAG: hypothetical protein KJ579_02475 [Verrucomicrobia bacterium]|nr:hypothetical protein [Verrucomicrobiota bacterium]
MIVMFEPLPVEPWWAGVLRALRILPKRRDTVTLERGSLKVTLRRGIPVEAPWWTPRVWEDWPAARGLGMRCFVPYEARGPREAGKDEPPSAKDSEGAGG